MWIRLKELSEKYNGWLNGTIASRGTNLIKSADIARAMFLQMSQADFGETRGEDKKLEWRYVESSEIDSTLLQSEDLAVA